MSDKVRAALAAIVEGKTLSTEDARVAMGSVMDGEATPAQLAALLVALRMRGETVEELAGIAMAMRERVLTSPPRTARSTPAEPAAITAARSTSPRPRRWSWLPPACRWPSTATGP